MSQRTEQVAALLQQAVNEILVRDFESPKGCLVTINRVEVTPDLKHAKVMVSVLPENVSGTALSALRKQSGHVQWNLRRKLSMKFVPQISWEYDETNIKLDRIDQALRNS